MEIQTIKQRFGIIGNSHKLNRAIEIAVQVASTDMSVLISGESGSGKEVFPQIVHHYSSRKHGQYIAVNCGAIPEGTIDSELFGHEKGSFTGAHEKRKGYFEVADGGTIFLDEVAELPLSTQVRLLRVLETGEFFKVGSSNVLKSNVRVVAATNVNITDAIRNNKFREDLYYRLNTVPIFVPSLNERKEDIYLLFRKFALDFSEKYRMPPLVLDEAAQEMLIEFKWPGNVRQLKNIIEQISVIEQTRQITGDILQKYLPTFDTMRLPALYKSVDEKTFASEREILYKILFDLKKDMTDLKKLVIELLQHGDEGVDYRNVNPGIIKKLFHDVGSEIASPPPQSFEIKTTEVSNVQDSEEVVEESLSLENREIELIRKALDKHLGKRKNAADDLGISERTLYRKIKEHNLD